MNDVDKTTKKQLGGATGKGFMPGVSGNPKGRPKGTVSITEAIRRKLNEMAPSTDNKEKRTYLEVLIIRIMNKAIIEGDQQMISRIWNYIDGMPKQSIEHTGKMTLEEFLSEDLDEQNRNESEEGDS
jgi:hypothetical protein